MTTVTLFLMAGSLEVSNSLASAAMHCFAKSSFCRHSFPESEVRLMLKVKVTKCKTICFVCIIHCSHSSVAHAVSSAELIQVTYDNYAFLTL